MSNQNKAAGRRTSKEVTTPINSKSAAPLTDKRPGPNDYTKWETPLPFNLEDFMNQYVAWKEQGVEHPEWKQNVVLRFEGELKGFIRQHWKESSKTRKKFVSMNPQTIWVDQDKLDMKLTKRNLATLDPDFIPSLDQHCLAVLTDYIETIRTEANAIMDGLYPTNAERADMETRTAGTEHTDYTFENYGKHLKLQEELRFEVRAKFAVIEYTRQRELYVQNLVKWETDHKETATEPVKGEINMYNWIAKFRIDASNILAAANKHALELIKAYEQETGKEFQLYGQKYVKLFLEPQMAQASRVKTNFANMTADILFFDNPGDEAEGSPITTRILDPLVEPIVATGTPVQTPPKMPEYAKEVGFEFSYY
jgi:hypothetical protein